jgi:hypothetical protein
MKVFSAITACALALVPAHTEAVPTTAPTLPLVEYKYFRSLSIDLVGRAPTREELAERERPGFDLEAWIDAQLTSTSYADRVRRVYQDLLRLELPQNVDFEPSSLVLRRARITGPDGNQIDLYWRLGQRRALSAIDGDICFTGDEAEIDARARGGAVGSKPVKKALLEARTVEVKPWWLYADYRERDPRDRVAPEWEQRFPGLRLLASAFVDANKVPTTSIRVCREEAQTAEVGRVYLSNRAPVAKSDPIPMSRKRRLPNDTAFAKANVGKPISCLSHVGFINSTECGCGVGLERCFPNAPNGFVIPMLTPLGTEEPFMTGARPAEAWIKQWWADEPTAFMDRIFREDRDLRELLTSRETVINGPLAQFYRFMTGATYTGAGIELGYSQPDPLFDPSAIPKQLKPYDVASWTPVDRGPRGAGLLTMPVFLMKYGSRRARAHVVYQAFLCRDFLAPRAKLVPSTQPDLAKRPGCATCHRTLEPMSAYFSRIQESDWTYLPAKEFPALDQRCASSDPKRMRGECRTYYDPDFTDDKRGVLRGAYASPANAEAGPRGLAEQVVRSPDFASCVAQNVASSFLGRSLGVDDRAFQAELAKTLVAGGYKMRALVKAIVKSPQYRTRSAMGHK